MGVELRKCEARSNSWLIRGRCRQWLCGGHNAARIYKGEDYEKMDEAII